MSGALAPASDVIADRLSPIEDVIATARAGRMFILVDAEGRENEGDLVVPADAADAQAINFMAMHGRGLISLALMRGRAEQLGLELMSRRNRPRRNPEFTVSIEAREGVSTGISAADRARTIVVAIDPATGRDDITTPGHVFPLVARDGGVLVRAGRTEAAVDVARLAGRTPAGVLCEIVNEDGTMAKLGDIVALAEHHDLKITTVAALIAHRLREERLVERVREAEIESVFGGNWKLVTYWSALERAEYAAIVKGDLKGPGPSLVRMHALDPLRDVLGAAGPANDAVRKAMAIIAAEGKGAIVLIRNMQPLAELAARRPAPPPDQALREYGIGAQILVDLGIHEMVLLSNSEQSVIALDGYGLKIIGRRPLT
jgi:3,4-dihydroxy 2-butanone 4-phosphate synthase/GTP cyclohydrolase II